MLYGMEKRWRMIATVASGAFLTLAFVQYLRPDFVQGIDAAIASAVAPLQTYAFVQGFLLVTALGDAAGVIAIALGATFFLRSHPGLLARLWLALAASTLVVNATKVVIARARPEALVWLDPLLSFSFPSGHAAAAATLFGFIAVASARLLSGRRRSLAIALSLLLILGVGASRIVIGAHFFSDVVGGYLAGIAFVALAFSVRAR